MDDVLATLVDESLNHEERHDVVVHPYLGGLLPFQGSVEEDDGNASLYYLII